MAETHPQLVSEHALAHPQDFGSITLPSGEVCPIIIRISPSSKGVMYVELANDFRLSLHSKPHGVLGCADEISAMLRDAILREFVATVVS